MHPFTAVIPVVVDFFLLFTLIMITAITIITLVMINTSINSVGVTIAIMIVPIIYK